MPQTLRLQNRRDTARFFPGRPPEGMTSGIVLLKWPLDGAFAATTGANEFTRPERPMAFLLLDEAGAEIGSAASLHKVGEFG